MVFLFIIFGWSFGRGVGGHVIGGMGYSSSHGDNIVVEYDSYDWLL